MKSASMYAFTKNGLDRQRLRPGRTSFDKNGAYSIRLFYKNISLDVI